MAFHRIRKKKESDEKRKGYAKRENALAVSPGKIDVRFLCLCAALLLLGALMNYSASSVYAKQFYGTETYFLIRYLLFAAGSCLVAGIFVKRATLRFWRFFVKGIVIAAIGMLLLVLVIGTVGGGAKRWLVIGPLTIQPSEVAKLAVVMALSFYLAENEEKVTSEGKGNFVCGVLVPGGIIATFGLLVALEKHISGLMIIGMIGIAVMFLGGTRMRWLLLIGGTVALAGVCLILVSEYAQTRVNTWIHIDEVNPLGEAWQTLQGLYAIGSGGVFGRGLFGSLQKYGYVSQPQNDFVFTILCEDLGCRGASAVIGLFAALVIRGFRIASAAPDKFSALVVAGLSFKVAIQTVLNLAVVTNSMPNTGISLPFFSSGGTSLALQIFEMGIILNISRYCVMKK